MNAISKISLISLFIITLSFIASENSLAEIVYSHEFEEGVVYGAGTPQFDDWISFRASLPASGVNRITLSGSRDQVGRTCNNPPAAQQLANALRQAGAGQQPENAVLASLNCGGFLWTVTACDSVPNNTMLRALDEEDDPTTCSCDAKYALGPGITDGDWGGIDGPICSAPTQTITVNVLVGPDSRPIPTLSEWGLIAAAGMLGIAGFIAIRRKLTAV